MYFKNEVEHHNTLDTQHKHGEFLLSCALFSEKNISYKDQSIVYNEWSKPSLRDYPDIHYNVSHCDGLTACAIADVPVGIDVENIRAYSDGAANHVCDKKEIDDICGSQDPDRRFFMYWTLKESCTKAMGCGVSYPMKKIVFQLSERGIECLTLPQYQFLLIEDESPYIIAACYQRSGESVRIVENEPGWGR